MVNKYTLKMYRRKEKPRREIFYNGSWSRELVGIRELIRGARNPLRKVPGFAKYIVDANLFRLESSILT